MSRTRLDRPRLRALSALLLAALALPAAAQQVLIRGATVHTATAQGTLKNTDVLVQGGVIRAIGSNLATPADGRVIDARGRPLTPALFGGITEIGIEEVSGEDSTVDSGVKLADQPMRPEFDVTLAYNPESVLVPVARVEGIGFTALGATTSGAFIAGQGGIVRLDGSPDPVGPHALFLRIVVQVERAADIRQLLRWAQREKVRIAIAGGAEAWKLAPQLAQAKVPVLVNALADLPATFDQIGATLENAARLRAAGVEVSFSQSGDASHNARKLRQLAGNAVANGLPWEAGLVGLTRVPAEIFGVADRIGSIAVGKQADLVLWEGDPLDVAHYAEQVWLGGREMPMRSRQTELRDRYMPQAGPLPRAYLK